MKLSDYKTEDDEGYMYDGCFYEDAGCMIQSGIFELCCCGNLTDNLIYILQGLELIAEQSPDGQSWDLWWDEHDARVMNHFKTRESMFFFYYWADKEKLTDHGGAVPGWLNDKGKDVLGLLREWRNEQVKKG